MAMNRSWLAHQQRVNLLGYNLAKMALPDTTEAYICVDVETAGPIPGPKEYSLLSIGACTINEPQSTYYIEIKPINENIIAEAATVHKLSMQRLMVEGIEPKEGLRHFEEWLKDQTAPGQQPVFVAFNAPFDWMFINYYFFRYLGHNPFGHTALDIKAFYMGWAGVPWSQTSWRFINPDDAEDTQLTHPALQDALDQARLFKKMLGKLHKGN
jgi:DNA polymerase III epsilon subunit-like protein